MDFEKRVTLDMTPDGRFAPPPPRRGLGIPVANRIILWSVAVAVGAGALTVAAIALWVALSLIPVVLAAVLFAVVAFRFKAWQARRPSGRSTITRPWGPFGR